MKILNIILVILCLALIGVIAVPSILEDNKSECKQGNNQDDSVHPAESVAVSLPEDKQTDNLIAEGNVTSSVSPVANDEEHSPSRCATDTSAESPSPPSSTIAQWTHPKEWYRNLCNLIRKNVNAYLEGPYSCDRALANRILAQANSIEQNLYSSSAEAIDEWSRTLGEDYKRFQNGCSWQSGIRHPQYAHVISSSQQNVWCAESGWEFVNPGTADLTVRRAKVVCRCDSCRGSGQKILRSRCPNCGGRGMIDNPAAFATQAAVNIAGLFGKRGMRRAVPTGPRTIPCSNCQGQGQIQVTSQCGTCGGSGKILR